MGKRTCKRVRFPMRMAVTVSHAFLALWRSSVRFIAYAHGILKRLAYTTCKGRKNE